MCIWCSYGEGLISLACCGEGKQGYVYATAVIADLAFVYAYYSSFRHYVGIVPKKMKQIVIILYYLSYLCLLVDLTFLLRQFFNITNSPFFPTFQLNNNYIAKHSPIILQHHLEHFPTYFEIRFSAHVLALEQSTRTDSL